MNAFISILMVFLVSSCQHSGAFQRGYVISQSQLEENEPPLEEEEDALP